MRADQRLSGPLDLALAEKPGCPTCGHAEVDFVLEAPDWFFGRDEIYRLVRCRNCWLVRLENAPKPEEMGFHYGSDYDKVISSGGEDFAHWRLSREILFKEKRSGAILDIGCNAGGFLASLDGKDWKLHGIEMSQAMARRAEAATGANVFVGDILDAPFAPASFDAITMFHVLEHVYDPPEVLARISQWLKPGGVFYAIVPNIESAGARLFGRYWYALELPRHLYHFSPRSLRALFHSLRMEDLSFTLEHEPFIEASASYYLRPILRKAGFPALPAAQAKTPGIPFRLVRKALRLTLRPVLNWLISLTGDGEIIHVVFRKAPAAK